MHRRVLHALALFASRHYKGVCLTFAVLVVLSIFAATRIRFDTDMLNLLPPDDPSVAVFRETVEEFGTLDYLLIGVRVPEGAPLVAYQEFVDLLGPRLEKLEGLGRLDYRIETPEQLLSELFPASLLFLDDSGRELLAERLTDEGIERRAQELRRLLGTPQGIALKDLLKVDPFGVSELLLDRLQGSRGSLAVDWTSGYYLSKDRRLILLLARPTQPPQAVQFIRALVAEIETEIEAAQAEWSELQSDSGPENMEVVTPPEVFLGGSYLTTVDDAKFIANDAIRNAVTSVLGVLLLFLIAFRRWSALLYAFLPLFCGLVLTFGFAKVALGDLSQMTSGVAALLIGLGIDFVIVSYGRYVEERQLGNEPPEALKRMSGSSGRAVVVGAVTTAATFGAFLATGFPGLRQMGILTAGGILLCMLTVLLLLPALLAWGEERHRKHKTLPNLYLHNFGTDALIRASMRHAKVVLALGLALTIVAVLLLSNLGFEPSISTMRPRGNRGLQGAQEVARHFGSGFDYSMLVISGDSPEEVVERASQAAEAAQALVTEGVLSGTQGPHTLLPSAERQADNLEWLRSRAEEGQPIGEALRERIELTFRAEGINPVPFRRGVDLLQRALDRQGPLTYDELSNSELMQPLLSPFLRPIGDNWRGIVRLYQADNRWRAEPPPQAVALAEALGPDVQLAGTNVVNQRVKVLVLHDAYLAGGLGTALVALLIWLDFRRLRDMVLALVPLGIGILWMLGAMSVIGLQMNFMNIFVTTMIVGIGVDYGLHIIHRYREIEQRGGDGEQLTLGLQETGKAILAAALSTLVGFGSMSLSHYPALRTTGYVAILGALACALVAITLVPAWLHLTHRERGPET